MKTTIRSAGLVILGIGLVIGGCAKKKSSALDSIKNPEIAARLKSFVAEKETQAAKADRNGIAPQFKPFFSAAEKGDWLTMSDIFPKLQVRTGQAESQGKDDLIDLQGIQWETLKEIWGAFDEINAGDEKFSTAFGNDIIESIPPKSIYFGGTDSGRFIVTALQKSHQDGDPFFTLTQNALANGRYLDYLRSMYGEKIYIPTPEDSQKCFQDYTEDVTQRRQKNQLKPGEDVQVDAATGRVQVSGQVAVMEINGLLAKVIFDKNANQEFFVEESFPLDWMYPYLEPHGLIFKLNRQPLSELSGEIVQQDHDYWTKSVTPMIGDWLNSDTSVEEVTAFAKKVFLQRDFVGFAGDPQFVQNDYSCKMFSKERASLAGLYVWRMNQAATADEKERMAREADFAFRQALALCPYSPEAVKGYANFLKSQNRDSDAVLVSETAKQFPKQK
jgi:hypothetical protein